MKKETAIDFMLYSLMGVTLNDCDDKNTPVKAKVYLDKAVRRAYRDACSHVLSVEEGEGDCKKNPKKKEEAIRALVEALEEFEKDASPYECWHKRVCMDLCEKIYAGKNVDYKKEDSRTFSYGIAQKWVNMTIKYLTVLYTVMDMMAQEQIEVNQNFKEYYEVTLLKFEKDFHVPVDGYILEGIWDKGASENGSYSKLNQRDREELVELIKEDGATYSGKYSSEKIVSWSKWKKCRYVQFQEKLRNKLKTQDPPLDPLDWENSIWIKVAKSREKQK